MRFGKIPVGENTAHKVSAVVFISFDFHRVDIAAVPAIIAFLHTVHTPFGANDDGFYAFFPAQLVCEDGTGFTPRHRQNRRAAVPHLQNRFKAGRKVCDAEIAVTTGRPVKEFEHKKRIVEATNGRFERKGFRRDRFADDRAEFVFDKSGRERARDGRNRRRFVGIEYPTPQVFRIRRHIKPAVLRHAVQDGFRKADGTGFISCTRKSHSIIIARIADFVIA